MGGISIGGTKRDRNCEAIVLANMFAQLHNFSAAARVLCGTDAAKKAKLTEADCVAVYTPPPAPVIVVPPAPAPVTVVVPERTYTEVYTVPLQHEEITVTAPPVKKVVKRKPSRKPVCGYKTVPVCSTKEK